MKATDFQTIVEHIGNSKPSSGKRLRAFWDDLFGSAHVAFVERELVNVRIDKNRQIEQLRQENAELKAKIEKLELAVWPQSSRAGQAYAATVTPPREAPNMSPILSKFEQLVAKQAELNQKEEAKEN